MTAPLVIALCLVSAVIAGVMAALYTRSRTSATEAVANELRQQLATAQSDFKSLREQLAEAEAESTGARARLEENVKHMAEQKAVLEEAKTKLSDAFKSLAADALASNNKGFITLAEAKFKALSEESKTDLDARKKAIHDLVEPLNKTLSEYQKETQELEQKRQKEIGTVGEQLRKVAETHADLSKETGRLVNALKSPQVRGRWGEIALRKTAELAGMDEDDLATLFVLGSTWVGYIQQNSGDWNAIADLGRVEAIMNRVVEIDEGYEFGQAHMYLGALNSILPASLGGQPDKARVHFEKAIALSKGRNLLAKTLFAEKYARLTFDQALHDQLLEDVLASDSDVHGLTLQNEYAKQEARRLLASSADYFE